LFNVLKCIQEIEKQNPGPRCGPTPPLQMCVHESAVE
ncbi:hypothetical protein CDAR_226711, partial [Caerostris darwini]